MDEKTHCSTGQVTGITGIPQKTMQRYIHDFRDSFSPDAAKPTKGRRFTEKDINTLLLLRRLHYERKDPATIKAALKGDITCPKASWIDTDQIARIALEALEINKQAAKALRESNSLLAAVSHKLKKIEVRELNLSELDKLRIEVSQLREELGIRSPAPEQKTSEPHRGIFSRLLG